jgi:hypothetical protein
LRNAKIREGADDLPRRAPDELVFKLRNVCVVVEGRGKRPAVGQTTIDLVGVDVT